MASKKRLIDVTPENVKAVLEKVPYYQDEIWKFTAMTERFSTVDAVEVVRCKDCKWRQWDDVSRNFCGLGDFYCGELDYCSRGERRADRDA